MTTIDIGFMSNNGSGSPYYIGIGDLSAGGQVDIQIQAFIGYYKQIQIQMRNPYDIYNYDIRNGLAFENVFTGENSGWSNTQTFTMPESYSSTASTNSTPLPSRSASSSQPSMLPTLTPTVPEFPATLALTFLLMTAALAVAVIHRKRLSDKGLQKT